MDLLAFGNSGYGDELANGLLLTVALATSSYLLSLILGILFGFIGMSKHRVVRCFWRIYRSIAMGVPSLLVIFFIYYNLPVIIKILFKLEISVTPLMAGIMALSMVYASYIGEAVRGAIINIPAGQFEAGRALGLHIIPLWGFVIIPQAVKLALPGMVNIWLILLKDTALVSLVGLVDIVRVANIASGVTYKPFLFYITAAMAFILITLLSMIFIRRAENWAYRDYSENAFKQCGR